MLALDSRILTVFVDNPNIVEEVNHRSKSVQKQIIHCNLDFDKFRLEVK